METEGRMKCNSRGILNSKAGMGVELVRPLRTEANLMMCSLKEKGLTGR
jgi:hypothetical protein